MAPRVFGVIAIAVAVLLGGNVQAQEVLTNDAVITMVKAGLSENLILAKIRSTTTKFDVRAETLVSLKAAGVPERVIEAMVAQNGRAGAVSASPAAALAAPEATLDRFRR